MKNIHQKGMANQSRGAGFTLTETLIIGALLAVIVLIGTLILSTERARTRDTKRIADMTRLAAGFAILYGQQASYAPAAAGCSTIGSNAAGCTLTSVVSNLGQIVDPGKFSYTINRVPDKDDFGVKFRLEKNYGSLKAGWHTLSKTGIK